MKIKSLNENAMITDNTLQNFLKKVGLSIYYATDVVTKERITGILPERSALEAILKFMDKNSKHIEHIDCGIIWIDDLSATDDLDIKWEHGGWAVWCNEDQPIEERVDGDSDYCVSVIKAKLNGKDSNKRTIKPKIMVTGAWGGSYVGGGKYEGGRYYFKPFEVEDTDDSTLYTGLVENIPDPEEAATLDHVDKLIVYTSVGDFTLEDY